MLRQEETHVIGRVPWAEPKARLEAAVQGKHEYRAPHEVKRNLAILNLFFGRDRRMADVLERGERLLAGLEAMANDVRLAAKRRYVENRAVRAEENRAAAKRSGAGTKKNTGGGKKK